MNSLCNSVNLLTLKPSKPQILSFSIDFNNRVSIIKPLSSSSSSNLNPRRCRIRACAAAADHASPSDIDMVRTKEGVYAAKRKKVVVLWDLDNKPPRGPPYQAAMALRQLAQQFGDVVSISAYANRHAFVHLPQWVVEARRERRSLDFLERKGVAAPPEPYVCGVCGRKCKTNMDLKKHFRQLHERERQKKLNRMGSLKGKKRQRFKERFVDGNHKYEEAARSLITPKVGYGLASELRRAGVFVKTVEDKPQAADWALKKQMQHTMSRGIDWLFLVSDDSDFSEMLRRAGESNLGTVVVGDSDRALGRHADLWVPWNGVENGEVSKNDLVPRSRRRNDVMDSDNGEFSNTNEKLNLDSLMDELVGVRTEFTRISEFVESDEEEEDWAEEEMDQEGDEYGDDDFFLDNEDE